MKVTVEIKDDKFSYDFEVGKEKGHGDRPLCVYGVRLFSSIVEECHKTWARHNEDEMHEIRCFAYLEKHPETIKKFIELEKKRGNKV